MKLKNIFLKITIKVIFFCNVPLFPIGFKMLFICVEEFVDVEGKAVVVELQFVQLVSVKNSL